MGGALLGFTLGRLQLSSKILDSGGISKTIAYSKAVIFTIVKYFSGTITKVCEKIGEIKLLNI